MAEAAVKVDDNGVRRALSDLARGLTPLSRGLDATGSQLLNEVTPLVPILTGRLADDLKAETDGDAVTVSIGDTPRVGDYAAIINARAGFMTYGEDVAEDVALGALTTAVDDLIRSAGLN